MKHRRIGLALIALFLALSSCKTKPPALPPEQPPPAQEQPAPAPAPTPPAPAPVAPVAPPPAPEIKVEKSALQAESSGFWPALESRRKTIQFSLLFGNRNEVKTWRLDILPASGNAAPAADAAPVKRFQGAGADQPASVAWDGRKDDGQAASEGGYVARLSIDYGGKLAPVALDSKRFILSISPPEPLLKSDPARFEPSVDGVKAPVSIVTDAKPGLARIDSWSLEILDPDGTLFRSFSGFWPALALVWDGRSDSGSFVEPGKRYTAILEVTDEFGHAAATRLSIPVAALPYATERSQVAPLTAGFSPNGDKTMDAMDFNLVFGNRDAVASWKMEAQGAGYGAVGTMRTWSGAGGKLPETLVWDGLTDKGDRAPEGRYTMLLSIDYGKRYANETARSPSFILDVSPPSLSVSTSPELFSPDGDGVADLLEFKLDARTNLARIADWSIDIYSPAAGIFARLDGPWGAQAGKASWNGLGSSGELVDSAEEYPYVARVRDEFGNAAQARGKIATDILAVKEGDRYRISVTSIVFKGFTADYRDLPPELARQNLYTLDRLAAKLAKFPGYRIELVGHAVMLNWDDPVKGEIEQREVLIPLSVARSKAIAAALRDRGIEVERIRTDGVGAVSPVVPDSDTINRWKNRRVEFFLDKK